MKAKDTVIIPIPEHQQDYEILEKQAEVSFKAGIQEVAEWVGNNAITPPTPFANLEIQRLPWQSKLKEWGIK